MTGLGLGLVLLMGLSLGLLGGGGSILSVPILVYVMGLEVHPAIALSLLLVGGTACVAMLLHQRRGYVDWRGGLLFALFGAPTGIVGGWLSHQVPGTTLLLLFGLLMVVAGGAMLRRRREAEVPADGWRLVPMAASGAGIGFATGFLGIGGGFMIVPALVLFARLPMRHAVGTSLLVIVANCLVAFLGHHATLGVRWGLAAALAASALTGTVGGVALSRRMTPGGLRAAFGALVIVIGLAVVIRNASLVWGR